MPTRRHGNGKQCGVTKLKKPTLLKREPRDDRRRVRSSATTGAHREDGTSPRHQALRARRRAPRTGPFTLVREVHQPTALELQAVSTETRVMHRSAMQIFDAFMTSCALPVSTDEELDLAAANYVNLLWNRGAKRHEGTRFYAVLMDRFPRFGAVGSSALPKVCRALKGWSRLEPAMTRPPLPWTVAAWMMFAMLSSGQIDAALAVGLMFTTYYRPSEALGVREGDLIDPGPGDRHHAINLFPDERPERSKVGAANESLLIDATFLAWLGAALASRRRGRSDDPLLKMTLPAFVSI